MSMIDRIKNICLTPKTEWPVIAGETTSTRALLTGYVLPLAAIGAIFGFISSSLIGHTLPFIGGSYKTPILMGVGLAVFTLVMAVVGVFILSLIINALAPSFGGQKDRSQALKIAVYAYTPAWLAGVFQVLPWVGPLLAVLLSLYGLYLLFIGLPALMKNPQDQSIGYTVVVVVCAIVLWVLIGLISAGIFGAGHMAAMHRGGAHHMPAGDLVFDKDSPLGKLDAFGKKMEESGKAMEAAQKSGDQKAQADAAAAMFGTLMSGGKKFDPIPLDQLKPFVPEIFAGLAKMSSESESTGVAGLMIARTEATFGDGAAKTVKLEITDTGGASGLMGFASWASVMSEKEDKHGSEKTHKAGNRTVHEKSSKVGGQNEYMVLLGERFVVRAEGRGVDLGQLRSAVNGLNLNKLEGMKDVGARK